MSRDRFNELGNNKGRQPQYEMQQPRFQGSNGPSYSRSNASSSTVFDQTSEDIKAAIERINENTRELQSLHRKALVEMQSREAQVLSQKLDAIVDETSMIIQEARNELKGLTSAPGGDPSIKQVQQKALARKLMDSARDYQSVQQAAKAQYRKQLERQFRIAKPNATREEVKEAIQSGSGGVFQQQILSSRVGDQRRMLQDVQNRQQDLEKIEQSLIELFDLMQDMQMLLEQQQTFVNQIETNVESSAAHLEMGSTELTKATESSRAARKKKWIIFFCVLVLLAVLAVVLWFYVISPAINASNAAATAKAKPNQPQ